MNADQLKDMQEVVENAKANALRFPEISFDDFEALVKLGFECLKLREQLRWIPVSERLPADARNYLVTDGESYAEAYWGFESAQVYENQKIINWIKVPAFIATDSHVSTYSGAGEAELNFTPTHWMPLPTAPAGEQA